jgi:phosphopantetheinyl transferase (holo-ACP synthase)
VPEIFRSEKKNGFINIWQIEEPIAFFENCIDAVTLKLFLNRFTSDKRVIEKLVPHYVLKQNHAEEKIDNTERKPVAKKGFISVSHCKDFVATAYSISEPQGIDIEYYGDRILKIRHKYLDEKERVFCGDDSTKCIIVWAAKESIFKKFGGDSVYFAENIHVDEMTNEKQQVLNAKIILENKIITQQLFCELFDEFVLVYTL